MATVELVRSRATRKAGKASRHTRIYKVTGASDSAPALSAVIAKAPSSVVADGLTLDYVEYDANYDGNGLWSVSVNYSHKSSNRSESQNDRLLEVDDTETTFDFSEQIIHITEAFEQTSYGPNPPAVGKSINVTDDGGPEGVDVGVVAGVITRTKVFAAATVDDAWIKERAKKVSKVNDATFLTYDAGELLLSRFTGRQRGSAGDWHVTFSFKVGENETGLTVASITGVDKKGFDYLWVKYEPEVDATNDAIVPTAQGVYVAEVYKDADFSTLLDA